MKIDVITYKDELRQDLKSILRDYLNLVAEEVKHDLAQIGWTHK